MIKKLLKDILVHTVSVGTPALMLCVIKVVNNENLKGDAVKF